MADDKVVNLQEYKEENAPHEVAELICLHCMKRWISAHPKGSWVGRWACPKCGKVGGIIYTGQPLDNEEEYDKDE